MRMRTVQCVSLAWGLLFEIRPSSRQQQQQQQLKKKWERNKINEDVGQLPGISFILDRIYLCVFFLLCFFIPRSERNLLCFVINAPSFITSALVCSLLPRIVFHCRRSIFRSSRTHVGLLCYRLCFVLLRLCVVGVSGPFFLPSFTEFYRVWRRLARLWHFCAIFRRAVSDGFDGTRNGGRRKKNLHIFL